MSWLEKDWVRYVSFTLKLGLALSVFYLGWVFYERQATTWDQNAASQERPLHADLYVVPPRSNATTLATARSKLIGVPLWVKEGWRRSCEQDNRLLEPLETVTLTDIEERGAQTWGRFVKDGLPCDIAIASDGRFYVDDVFFYEDPVATYDHWSDEDWRKIRAHIAEPGMSYTQIGFALGLGRIVGGREGSYVVEYGAAEHDDLDPVRVVYDDYIAVSVDPIQLRES